MLASYPSSLVTAWIIPKCARTHELYTMLQRLIVESLSRCLPEGSVNADSALFARPHLFVSKCTLWNSRAHTTFRNIARRAKVEISVLDAFRLVPYLIESRFTHHVPTLSASYECQYDTKLMCIITTPVRASVYGVKGVWKLTSE